MIAAIMAALVAIATRGECFEADRYPTDAAAMAMVTGYVQIDSCILPTTAELTAGKLCRLAVILSNTSDLACRGGGIEIGS